MLEFDAGVVCCEVRVSLGVICMAVLLPSSDLIVALGHTPSFRRQSSTEVNPEAYLRITLTKIAEGHPINKIDQLMPWRMSASDPKQPA